MSSRTLSLTVFTLIVAGGLAYVLYSPDVAAPTLPAPEATNPVIVLKPTPTATVSLGTPLASPTAPFTGYEDPAKRFKVGVPQDWKVGTVASTADSALLPLQGQNQVILKKPTGESISITLYPAILNPSLQQWLDARDKQSQTAYEGQPSKKILTTKPTVVSGYPAIERKEEWLAAGFTTVVTYVMVEGNAYVIELIPQAELAASDLRATYEAVVGSLVIAAK